MLPIAILRGLAASGTSMHRLDMQHAVVEIGSGDLHVIGEAEAALKRAPRDAAVQEVCPGGCFRS